MPTAESNQTTLYAYDGSDHVILQTSVLPGGLEEQTQYVYGVSIATGSAIDSNDLLSQTRYPNPVTGIVDSTQDTTQTVNALGQVLTATDRNGTTHAYSYDVLGRLVSDAVTTLGAGVDGAVQRIDYGYDALGNTVLVTSYDAPSGGDIVNQIERVYNGLGQLTAEYQSNSGAVNPSTTPAVLYAYTEMAGSVNNSRLVSMTYPDGRVLDYNYASGIDDQISRLTSISDSSGVLESYTYLGLDTILQRVQPQAGTELTYIAQPGQPNGDAGDRYVGLDRFGRVVDQRWLDTSSGAVTDEVQYGYDPDGNVLYAQNMVNSAFSDLYHASGPANGYDALNQLTAYEQGTLSESGGSSVPDTVASPTDSQVWGFSALGNWSSVTTNGSVQARTSNLQNETTGVGSATLTYDTNGNLTTDQAGNQLVYDAWNRLVAVNSSSGATLATYSYDGLGRRVIEVNGTVQTALVRPDCALNVTHPT